MYTKIHFKQLTKHPITKLPSLSTTQFDYSKKETEFLDYSSFNFCRLEQLIINYLLLVKRKLLICGANIFQMSVTIMYSQQEANTLSLIAKVQYQFWLEIILCVSKIYSKVRIHMRKHPFKNGQKRYTARYFLPFLVEICPFSVVIVVIFFRRRLHLRLSLKN